MREHPALATGPDPDDPTRLRASCEVARDGETFAARPPTRILEAARQLDAAGAGVLLSSICDSGLEGALDDLVERVGFKLTPGCLGRSISRDPEGLVRCEVFESLPPGYVCEDLPGRTARGSFEWADGVSATCVIRQRAVRDGVEPGDGWYYETLDDNPELAVRCSPERPQRIVLPPTVAGAITSLSCVRALGHPDALGARCGAGCAGHVPGFANELTCHAPTVSCQAPCASASDCPDGYVCDDAVCVHPTC